ncbi:MAG: 16S rRNA (adenine(1518)-N(6)/adenine(1519)-N(6))-dimethyltransferase RsmA [Acidobacteriota bacterium]|nr:16S rRNA (adenine(1518)-N(6)/adenine(1519)-N(6))-dimethyltransferase RsmA [Acidobacteriota bacterium]
MTRTPKPRAERPAAEKHRPRKRFAQHFLQDAWARKIVDAIDPQPGDVFLEIGPGEGALTLPLAERGVPILAVEVDRDLARGLAERVPPSVTIVTGDILETDVVPFLTGIRPQMTARAQRDGTSEQLRPRYRVAANLPYNISTPVLFKLFAMQRHDAIFYDATLMLQKELADRLAAGAGSRESGVLGIMAALDADVKRLLRLPPGAFRPPPKVHSAIVQLTFRRHGLRIPDEALFERMVQALFAQRRKTILNALKPFDAGAGVVLAVAGIDPRRRAETLQLTELARLAELFNETKRPAVL